MPFANQRNPELSNAYCARARQCLGLQISAAVRKIPQVEVVK